MDVTAITLGQPVLPGRLPFSKPKVNWLLQEKTVKNTEGVAVLQKNLKKIQKILYHSDVMLGFDNEIRMLCYILLRINLHCTLAL